MSVPLSALPLLEFFLLVLLLEDALAPRDASVQ
jgi:hypothetical protein